MTGEHGRIVQLRLISKPASENSLDNFWSSDMFFFFFSNLCSYFLQQVSLSLFSGLHFCERMLCKNLFFIQLNLAQRVSRELSDQLVFLHHYRYWSINTDLIDGDDHWEKKLNVVGAAIDVY